MLGSPCLFLRCPGSGREADTFLPSFPSYTLRSRAGVRAQARRLFMLLLQQPVRALEAMVLSKIRMFKVSARGRDEVPSASAGVPPSTHASRPTPRVRRGSDPLKFFWTIRAHRPRFWAPSIVAPQSPSIFRTQFLYMRNALLSARGRASPASCRCCWTPCCLHCCGYFTQSSITP